MLGESASALPLLQRGQISRTGEGGRGMATAGLILGYGVLVVGTALLVAFLALPGPVFDQVLADRRA